MSSYGLRIFAARAVPLVAMVLFSMNIYGQERGEAESAYLVIGCHNTPSRSSAVSLEVTKAWVEGDALFGDLLVANHSESAIRLPRENVGLRYWDAILEDQNVEHALMPLESACGGLHPMTDGELLRFLPAELEELVPEKDIESIAPGQTVLFRAVHLELLPSAARKPGREVRFEVRYRGGSGITLSAPIAEWLKTTLAEASSRHCSLYGNELKSTGHFRIP